ncbi:MAG: YidC/Oxa1 family membrane protein insertase [Patescibacteria group bacterium]
MNIKKFLLNWLLFFLLFMLAMQFFNRGGGNDTANSTGDLAITVSKDEYSQGQDVILSVRNNTESVVTLPQECPKNPFAVSYFNGEKFVPIEATAQIDCSETSDLVVKPGKTARVNYGFWKYALFNNTGRYKITIPFNEKEFFTSDFEITERGIVKKTWDAILFQPIYNALIFLITLTPGKSLGTAIILLTLVIRLILLVPSQHAMQSQRKMQEMQPKLEHIKKKFAGNQERIAKETMELWKSHKVNPFGSCMPLLVQFPILIALYYVISTGLNPDNVHLLYTPLKNADLTSIHTIFLNILPLTKPNLFVLPILIGLLQFIQIKLSMLRRSKPDKPDAHPNEMETVNKTMLYIMPVMIAVFTASVPAGVGLYWGISTLFAVGQQLVVNRAALKKGSHGIIEGSVIQ